MGEYPAKEREGDCGYTYVAHSLEHIVNMNNSRESQIQSLRRSKKSAYLVNARIPIPNKWLKGPQHGTARKNLSYTTVTAVKEGNEQEITHTSYRDAIGVERGCNRDKGGEMRESSGVSIPCGSLTALAHDGGIGVYKQIFISGDGDDICIVFETVAYNACC
jgi:hypothetical protein